MQPRHRPAQEREARARELRADRRSRGRAARRCRRGPSPRTRSSRGVPQRRTSTLACSSAPTGTLASGRLGKRHQLLVQLASGSPRGAPRSRSARRRCRATSAISASAIARPGPWPGRSRLRQRVAPRLQLFGARLQRLALAFQRARSAATSRKGCGDLRVSRRATTLARSLRRSVMSSMANGPRGEAPWSAERDEL